MPFKKEQNKQKKSEEEEEKRGEKIKNAEQGSQIKVSLLNARQQVKF